MSTNKKITLNFFGEIVSIANPQSLDSLRKSISSLFCFSPEDAKEILITYNENGDKIMIENDEDLKAFLKSKVTTIDLDISQTSQIYKKNAENIKQENEKDKLALEGLLKRNEELKKMKETEFVKEKEEIEKLRKQIMELNKQKHEIRKKIMLGMRKINMEKTENDKKIIELQKKLGLPITKSKPECKHKIKKGCFRPMIPFPFGLYHPINHRFPPMRFHPKRPLGVNFGNIDYINYPKNEDEQQNEDIKNRTIDEWGKCLFEKTEKLKDKFFNKFKDFPLFPFPFNKKEEDKKEENKEIHNFVRCDGCKMFPLIGKRYKCKTCPNFDFCENCMEKNKETHKHEFKIVPPRKHHHFPHPKKIQKIAKKIEKCKTERNIFEKEKEKEKVEENKIENNKLADKLVHFGITCDGCGVFPIIGCRYKCAICEDFDFCEECEKKYGEEHSHPFLKIYEPKMTPISFKCSGKK